MTDEAAARRAQRAEQAAAHQHAQRERSARESAKAQVLVDRFVEEARRRGVPTEELMARPWSGSGRYRTGITGWYVRKDRSLGIGEDGSYYVLVVAPVRLGRWRTAHLTPTPPPLEVGRGARDGEALDLEALLALRLRWDDATRG